MHQKHSSKKMLTFLRNHFKMLNVLLLNHIDLISLLKFFYIDFLHKHYTQVHVLYIDDTAAHADDRKLAFHILRFDWSEVMSVS